MGFNVLNSVYECRSYSKKNLLASSIPFFGDKILESVGGRGMLPDKRGGVGGGGGGEGLG